MTWGRFANRPNRCLGELRPWEKGTLEGEDGGEGGPLESPP
jgi:hypothetical protein